MCNLYMYVTFICNLICMWASVCRLAPGPINVRGEPGVRSGHRDEKKKQPVWDGGRKGQRSPHGREDTLGPDRTHGVKVSSPTW